MAERWADLHLHTLWSDGTTDLSQTVRRAKKAALQAIAITDHDTIGPDIIGPSQWIDGVEVICGVEIKAEIAGKRGEILGYFLNPDHPALGELFRWMAIARTQRMQTMIDRCNELLGLRLSYEQVAAKGHGSMGRPHLAQVLYDLGVVDSLEQAFNLYLRRGAPCYVPLPRPSSHQVIEAIRAAGGVAALAHPGLLPILNWGATLELLSKQGMAAIEVYYPYDQVTGEIYLTVEEAADFAERFSLIPTGGSDDHGPGSVKESLGMVKISYSAVDRLRSVSMVT